MSDWAGILWLAFLLVGNAFFVAAEFAVMSARRSQIEPLAEAGSKRAQTTLRAMENVSLMLACAQLGITVCSLLILLVAEPAIHHLLAVPLEAAGVPVGAADIVAFAVALLVVTFLHVTFGEMVPKNISVSVADKAALLLAPPLMFIARLVKPVIAALNGLTLAGGLELALAADFMVASSSARVGDVHATFGLVPGGGGSQRLTDAVGSRTARWLMFTGETLDAEQARSIGLVHDIFDADTFVDDVWAFATKIASRSATGLAFMKRMSRPRAITDDGLDLEIDAAAHLVVGLDAREGS